MPDSIALRLELLKMARELVINEYIDRRAQDHNLWIAQSDELMRTRGFKLQYPAFPPYPTEADIIAKADALVKFMSEPVTPIEPQPLPQPISNSVVVEAAPISVTQETVPVTQETVPTVPTYEPEITLPLPIPEPAAVESLPVLLVSEQVDVPAEIATPPVVERPDPVKLPNNINHNAIVQIFKTEAAPTDVLPQPAPPTGDPAIMKIFQQDVIATTELPVDPAAVTKENEPVETTDTTPPSSLAASILPSWIMRNSR